MPWYRRESEGTNLRLRPGSEPLSDAEMTEARAGVMFFIPPTPRLLADPADPNSIREVISAEDVEAIGVAMVGRLIADD